VENCYQAQVRGELTQEQAMQRAADLVRNMLYDNGQGYFTIDTDEGMNVVLLGTAAEGKPRMDAKDPDGRYFIREMISQAKAGGGFSEFMFPKPGTQTPLPKLYYTMEFAPYHWVIGTGIWIDQIDRRVVMREKAFMGNMKAHVVRMLTGIVLLEAFFVLLAVYTGGRLAYPIQVATKRMKELGDGILKMDEETEAQMQEMSKRHDELGAMSRAMSEMNKKLYKNQMLILSMAQQDMLTGLANRRHFGDFIKQCSADTMFTLISLDLDHFKEVNDNFGHQTGDAALLILAEVLKLQFPDALNVRMGGDEFLVVLTGKVQRESVEERLESFMRQLISVYQQDPGLKCLTVSAGIAYADEQPVPIDVLMNRSDKALYAAKAAGRSCYRVYSEELENK
jgi:methyl-accepting chemotaxis protein